MPCLALYLAPQASTLGRSLGLILRSAPALSCSCQKVDMGFSSLEVLTFCQIQPHVVFYSWQRTAKAVDSMADLCMSC